MGQVQEGWKVPLTPSRGGVGGGGRERRGCDYDSNAVRAQLHDMLGVVGSGSHPYGTREGGVQQGFRSLLQWAPEREGGAIIYPKAGRGPALHPLLPPVSLVAAGLGPIRGVQLSCHVDAQQDLKHLFCGSCHTRLRRHAVPCSVF